MNQSTAATLALESVTSESSYEHAGTPRVVAKKNIWIDRASIGLSVAHYETACFCGAPGCMQTYLFDVWYNPRWCALVSVADCGRASCWAS